MARKASTKLKDRMKSVAKGKRDKTKFDYNDIDYRIGTIESQIKNCEYDLQTSFRNNHNVLNKLKLLKEQLEILKKEKQNNVK